MIHRLSERLVMAMIPAPSIYGHIRRRKLIPPANTATISVCIAIFEVKKITVMKVNSALNWLMKWGMKFR